MAVEVTSWAELLQAASGDDPTVEINCPENAVWDLGESEPEGHTGTIKLCGQINGRGTKIKNLVLTEGTTTGIFDVKGTLTDLHFADGVWKSGQNYIVRLNQANSICQLCTFSASVQNPTLFTFFYSFAGTSNTTIAYRCAGNIEVATSTNIILFGANIIGRYNNFKLSGSRLTFVQIAGEDGAMIQGVTQYSYVTLDTPAVTSIYAAKFWWGLLRCTGANVTDLRFIGDGAGARITLACDSDFPNATQLSQGLRLCTEAQLHDAAYLQSIGFPIGVEY